MSKSNTWSAFYEATKSQPPSELLVRALEYVEHRRKAIDVGAGALKDTRFLLDQGFEVMAIDKEHLMMHEAETISSDRFHHLISSFADFNFPINEYDIASAMYALPFNPPETFEAVFQRIKDSLIKGGIMCGQFFGVRDEWHEDQNMTFHTKEQIEALLSEMEILELQEKEWEGKLASGSPKHWHVFH